MSVFLTIVLFLVVLAVLIFVHELGHFLAARTFGIRVDEFSLGFGPKIFGWKRGETTYLLKAIPFGGYVKIFGENPEEESISGPDKSRSFVHKPKWQQIIVLFSGILFNFIFGWLLISIAFMSGVPASIDSYPEYRTQMRGEHIAITYIDPASPADKAGLKEGDTILGFPTIEAVQKATDESGDKGITIHYSRAGKEGEATVIAKKGIVDGKYAIGIAMDDVATLQLPIHLSFIESARFVLHIIKELIATIYTLIAGIFTGTSSLNMITGPVGIASEVSTAASLGFNYLLMFTAIISINLGVINLIPFPALDGGRILFVIIESIIRRPIKPAIANTTNVIGFFLLIILIIAVTYHDILRLIVK